jgi:hypothetical protein
LRDRVDTVERAEIRKALTPELVVFLIVILVAMGLVMRTSSGECHAWKTRLMHVTGGFLASAGEEEFPTPGVRDDRHMEGLRRETSRLLDARPFGCF